MKPTLKKAKNVRGRITGYYADYGPITSQRALPTKAEAVAACEQEVIDALARLQQGTKIGMWNGHMYVISPEVNGWSTWSDIALPRTTFGSFSNGTRDENEDSIIRHLASNYHTMADDDAAYVLMVPERLRADLLSSFKWQRDMKRLTDAGHSDGDARDIISGFKKEVA